jgi:hypothetical protein
MSKLIIGTAGRHNVGFDIPELLVSRLLVQASSGGGKSFLLRRLLEQGFGKVQEIVIDIAGEFASLREKFGFVLVGEHGETPADIRSAGLVAEKLLELRASAVCDLYSLKPLQRHEWVRLFLTAVMNSPKRLWHPVLFVVDEAHKFCPEKGEGESEAKEMMLSLASDGRKYGFCAVFATQRLSKLDKSAASELTNVLIGPTFIDIDLQRACKALGIIPKEQAAFNEQMKTMAPGHFWALGRAITKTRLLVKIGGIQTTHPTAGSGKYSAEPPPPPDKVKALLPKLADLPQEAETKARTEAEFRREIRELTAKLKTAERKVASPQLPAASKVAVPDPRATQAAIQRQVGAALKIRDTAWLRSVRDLQKETERRAAEVAKQLAGQMHTIPFAPPETGPAVEVHVQNAHLVRNAVASFDAQTEVKKAAAIAVSKHVDKVLTADGEVKLGAIHKQIAGILAGYYPDSVKVSILAALVGATMGGSWSGRMSECRSAGLLEDPRKGYVRATEKCVREYLGTFQAPSTTEEVLAVWDPKWGGSHKAMIRFLIEQGEPVTRAALAQAVNMTLGGSFSGRLSELRSSGLLFEAGGMVGVNKEALFLEDAAARARA